MLLLFWAQQQKIIIDRFYSDEAFKKSVLDNANQAIKTEFGIDLPFPMRVVADGAGYRIEPIEDDDDHLCDQLELVRRQRRRWKESRFWADQRKQIGLATRLAGFFRFRRHRPSDRPPSKLQTG